MFTVLLLYNISVFPAPTVLYNLRFCDRPCSLVAVVNDNYQTRGEKGGLKSHVLLFYISVFPASNADNYIFVIDSTAWLPW